jgi:GTP-binding protein HflX
MTIKKFLQKLPMPNPKTFVGKGKLEEIREYIKENNVELVIFDDELSPSQLRNIERDLDCKILGDPAVLQPSTRMPSICHSCMMTQK